MAVELADGFFGVPGRHHLAFGVTGPQEPEQPRPAVVFEALVGHREEPPAAVERVVLPAPVAEGLVLHPPAALVELLVGQLDDLERVSHQGGTPELTKTRAP
ncbi:MAG TPA: hypothetical protein VGP46_12675 [Acidimicrobiales bacterium]|nr:hypothetical protein [Acidimicrobiales bacterium]